MVDYIYALFYIFDGKKYYFYVGRSIDPDRRMLQHRNDAKNNHTEDSREFIRDLWTVGLDFDHEILHTTTEEVLHVEDYFVNKLRLEGFELTNMKAGDSEPWMGRNYSSPEAFLKARERAIEKRRSKAPVVRAKPKEQPGETLFVGENPNKKFMSPAMKAILARKSR